MEAAARGVGRTLGRVATGLILLIVAFDLAAVAGGAAPPADAASPDLTFVAAARYDVQPDKHRVHVTVTITATNHSTDTVIRRYYVDHALVAVLPGTSGFRTSAVGSTAKPSVSVSSRTKTQTLLQIGFGTKLGSGRTLTLKLSFDLVDPGGAATRLVRIGATLATFPVWAFGSPGTSGGRVTVSFPAGYRVEVQGGPLSGPTAGTGGTVQYAAGPLAQPLTYVAYLVGDRPGAYLETPLDLTVAGAPLPVVVRAFSDDAAFGKRVAATVKTSLPALGRLIGIPVPVVSAGGTSGSATTPPDGSSPPVLAIEEAITRSAGGYAALYDVAGRRIEISYDATPGVILHEAAHAWFNGSLVADGWAAEGFTSYYAALAGTETKIAVTPQPLTKALLAARIPLNAWVGAGRPDPTTDAYVRAASLQLATLIAARAGPSGLTAVWKAAVAGEAADVPAAAGAGGPSAPSGSPAPGSSPSPSGSPAPGSSLSPSGSSAASPSSAPAVALDWRTLLDLLETRTGASYTDLWRTWVVRPEEAALLDQRAAARAAYASAISEAGGWELPATIPAALDAWQFGTASGLIARARAVLAARAGLASDASRAGLALPTTARVAFEGSGPATAASEMTAEEAAIAQIEADATARPADPDPVARVGLLGEQPDTTLAAARTAFAAGDLSAAVRSADAARAVWEGARDVGRQRLALVAGVVAVFGLAVLLVARRRDRHPGPALLPNLAIRDRTSTTGSATGPGGVLPTPSRSVSISPSLPPPRPQPSPSRLGTAIGSIREAFGARRPDPPQAPSRPGSIPTFPSHNRPPQPLPGPRPPMAHRVAPPAPTRDPEEHDPRRT